MLEALVRRSVKRRDDGFARTFAIVLGDKSTATTKARAIETLSAIAAMNEEKGTLTTVGSLTEHIRALDASADDAKARALAQVAIRRAIVQHGLSTRAFGSKPSTTQPVAVKQI